MTTEPVHLMKERKTSKLVVTKCGAPAKWATVWNSDVTCPACLEHIKGLGTVSTRLEQPVLEQPRKRIIKRT